jgi:hypothetical protein
LVGQPLVAKLLAAMSVDLLKRLDPDVELRPVKDVGGGIACPNCARPMTNDNYCGAGIVFFDRCDGCQLLWLDYQDLGAMTMMWARMEGRRRRNQDEFYNELRALPTVYYRDTTDLGVLVADIIVSGLLGG